MNVGTLIIDMAANVARLQKDMERATAMVESHVGRMQRMAEGLGAAFGSALAVLGTAGIFAKFIEETRNAEQEQAQLAAVLKSTGEKAGWARDQLNDMADKLSKSSMFSAGDLNQAQTRLLSYTGVVGQQFPRAMQAVIDMAQRMGMSVTQSAETIGRALDVPSQGLTALQRQGFRFTEAQKELVEKLEATGKTAEAQGIILDALEGSYGGAAAAARDTFGGALAALQNTINDLLTGDTGSMQSLKGSVEEVNRSLASEGVKAAFQTFISWLATVSAWAIKAAANVITFINVMARQDAMANNTTKANDLTKQQAWQMKQYEEMRTLMERDPTNSNYARQAETLRAKIQATSKAIGETSEALKGNANEALGTASAVEKVNVQLESMAGGGGGGKARKAAKAAKEVKDELADLMGKLNAKDTGVDASYWKNLDTLFKGYQAGKLSVDDYRDAVAKLTNQQQFAKDIVRQNEQAYEDLIEKLHDAQKVSSKQLETAADMLRKIEQETELLGLSNEERERTILSREMERAGIVAGTEAYDQYAVKIEAALARQQEINRELKQQEGVQQTLRGIDDTARQVFTNVFEDGAGSFKRLGQTLKASVLDLLYQLTVRKWVISIGASLFGDVGGAAAAALLGGNGGGGVAGLLSNGSSAYSALTGNNPIVNAVAGWLGYGSSSTIVGSAMGGYGATTAGVNIAGSTVVTPGLGGFGGTAISGGTGASAGMGASAMGGLAAGGLFAAAMLAAEYFLDSRPEYAGFASASTDTSRDAAGVSRDAAGITDLVNAHQPPPGSTRDYGNGMTGRWGDADLATNAGELAAIIGRTTMPGTSQGIATSNMAGLAHLGVMDWYEGAGYVDPSTLGHWETQYNAEWIRMSRALAQGVLGAVTTAAGIAGKEVDLRVIAGLRDEGKKDDLFGLLNIANGADALVNWEGKVKDGQEFLRGVANATLDAYGQLGLGKWAEGLVATTRDAISKLDADALGDKLGETALAAVDQLNVALAQMAAQLKFLINTVTEFAGVSMDSVHALVEAMGGLEAFNGAYGAYVGVAYSDEERQALARRQLQQQFDALGIAMPANVAALRALVESQDLNTAAGQAMWAALVRLAPALAEVTAVAETTTDAVDDVANAAAELAAKLAEAYDAAKANTDAVFAAMERNSQAELARLQTTLQAAQQAQQEAKGLFDLLHSSTQQLYGSAQSTASAQAAWGNRFIADAVATMRASGILPDREQLSEAITAARGGLNENEYATAAEFQRAQLVLAGQLADLEAQAGKQLTSADRQVQLIEQQIELEQKQLEEARALIEEARTSNTYLGTMAELAAALKAEYDAKKAVEDQAKAGADAAGGGAGVGAGAGGSDDVPFGGGSYTGSGRKTYAYGSYAEAAQKVAELTAAGGYAYVRNAMGGYEVLDVAGTATVGLGGSGAGSAALRDLIKGGSSGQAVVDAAVGMRLPDIAAAFGYMPRDMRTWLESEGYTIDPWTDVLKPKHSFAVGAFEIPQDMPAMLHAQEMVVPAPTASFLRRLEKTAVADPLGDRLSAVLMAQMLDRLDVIQVNTSRTADSGDKTADRLSGLQPVPLRVYVEERS